VEKHHVRQCRSLVLLVGALLSQAVTGAEPAVDPLVEASAYRDKTVWSYHDKEPVPWTRFRPRDYGSSKVAFSGEGVRPVGRVPAPGVHPRIFFSPEDLPAIRQRIKEDRGAAEAWKNVLAWSNALKLTYDEKADYAKPDWANGGFHIRGRFVDMHRIGGYSPKREDYFKILAEGGRPTIYDKSPPASFFNPAAVEAFRCLIDDDAEAARTLARATVTAVKLEQERRAKDDKPVAEGQPPKPSTSRLSACSLGFIYDFIFNWMTPEQRQIVHDELVTLSSGQDNYGTFNNAEASRSNWATFSYWVFDLMAIEGEPGFNDLKFLGLYRGWRNFYTYSFFDSGAAYEGEGKLLFGLDAAVAFDRVGHKYGLEPLTHHPLPRAYYTNFSARAMLPTRSSFAVFDILGSMGGGFTTPQDLVVAKYLFPADKGLDMVYRALVGDDYRTLPSSLHSLTHQAITSAVFATAYDPAVTPESAAIPLTFFCGQRALLMTRSSWDRDATMLTMHVRGASGGHPYPDRNGIMLAGQGRTWVTIPGKDIGGWAMNTVLIDGAEQNESTPGRVVDFIDGPDATFATGDAKYSWDWVWRNASKNKAGQPCTKQDVLDGTVDLPAGWELVKQSFDDFAWTKSDREVYRRPLEFTASWIGIDGQLTPVMRQPNLPVVRSFRTAGIVRGPRPYVLVVDDVQRDTLTARYEWNLTLPQDVVEARGVAGASRGDTVLTGKASLDDKGRLKAGEPALLVRPLLVRGGEPATLGERDKFKLLTLRAVAVSPEYRMLLHAFRGGEPLPKTTSASGQQEVTVEFPGQKDTLRFVASTGGRTAVTVTRAGKTLARLDRAVPPLDDPASAALTQRQVAAAERSKAMRRENFDPLKVPGFVAGWQFGRPVKGVWPAVAGSVPGTPVIPAAGSTEVPGIADGVAARMPAEGVKAPLVLPMKANAPFTVAFWTKTKSNPSMGTIVDFGGHGAVTMDVLQGGLRVSACRAWGIASMPTATLSGWTHFAVTGNGETLRIYRDGLAIAAIPMAGKPFGWGKEFRLGGTNGYGDAEASFASLTFYDRPLDADTIEMLFLAGRGAAPPARSASPAK
jgi:hypothetical protein